MIGRLVALFDEREIDVGLEARLFHRIEESLVRAADNHCVENQVQTARLLGITRNTMRTLLKRFGLLSSPLDIDTLQDEPAQAGVAHC